jgi:hypothetical protein
MEPDLKENPMRFLIFVCNDGSPFQPTPTLGDDTEKWVTTYDESGVRLIGDRIEPQSAAKAVRVRDGELLVTDGPFLETKEALGGFDVLECRDMDEAIEVAAAHPIAKLGVIEIRPFWTGD